MATQLAKPMTHTELLAAIQEKRAQSLAETLPPNTSVRIKPNASTYQFDLPTGVSVASIRGIIVDARYIKTYYEKAFRPANGGMPDAPVCWAINANANVLAPDKSATKPHCTSCEECEFNQFGSAIQGRGKRCADKLRLAIIPDVPPTDGRLVVNILELPATSQKMVQQIFQKCAAANDSYQSVVVEFTMDKSVTYVKVNTTVVGRTPDETFEFIVPAIEQAAKHIDRGYNFD